MDKRKGLKEKNWFLRLFLERLMAPRSTCFYLYSVATRLSVPRILPVIHSVHPSFFLFFFVIFVTFWSTTQTVAENFFSSLLALHASLGHFNFFLLTLRLFISTFRVTLYHWAYPLPPMLNTHPLYPFRHPAPIFSLTLPSPPLAPLSPSSPLSQPSVSSYLSTSSSHIFFSA